MFFPQYLMMKIGKDVRVQRRFCFTLILSLLEYKKTHFYIELYYNLLAFENEFDSFDFFWDVRSFALTIKEVYNQKYADLDKYFLNSREAMFILNQCLGYDVETVEAFEQEIKEVITEIRLSKKVKISRIIRGDSYNLTFFLSEACVRLLTKDNSVLGSRRQTLKTSIKGHTRRSSLFKSHVSVGENHYETVHKNEAIENELIKEKESLLEELKSTIAEKNKTKEGNLKLLAFIKEKERLLDLIRSGINKQVKQINSVKQGGLNKNEARNLDNDLLPIDSQLLYKGSLINRTDMKNFKKMMIRLNKKRFDELDTRKEEYSYCVRKVIKETQKIIEDRNFIFAYGNLDYDNQYMKESFKNVFKDKTQLNLSEFYILRTGFNYFPSEESQIRKIDDVMSSTNNNSVELVKQLIDQNSEVDGIEKDEMVDEYRERVKKCLFELGDLDEEVYMIKKMSRLPSIKEDPSNTIDLNEEQPGEEYEAQDDSFNANAIIELSHKFDFIEGAKSSIFQKKKEEIVVSAEPPIEITDIERNVCNERVNKLIESNFGKLDDMLDQGVDMRELHSRESFIESDIDDEPRERIYSKMAKQEIKEIVDGCLLDIQEEDSQKTEPRPQTIRSSLRPSNVYYKLKENNINEILDLLNDDSNSQSKEETYEEETVNNEVEPEKPPVHVRRDTIKTMKSRGSFSFKRFSSFKKHSVGNDKLIRDVVQLTEPIFSSNVLNDPHSRQTQLKKKESARKNSLESSSDEYKGLPDIRQESNPEFKNQIKPDLLSYNSLVIRNYLEMGGEDMTIHHSKKIPNIEVDYQSYKDKLEDELFRRDSKLKRIQVESENGSVFMKKQDQPNVYESNLYQKMEEGSVGKQVFNEMSQGKGLFKKIKPD